MDFSFTDDQGALLSALEPILADHRELPQEARDGFYWFDAALQQALETHGFLDAGRTIDPVAAALVTIETARLPALAETAASGLILPALTEAAAATPLALIAEGESGRAIRNLPIARSALIADGGDAVLVDLDGVPVERVESIYGYPYGRLAEPPDLSRGQRLGGKAGAMRQWHRVAIACEMAGAALSAVEFTVDYVKNRHVFGGPLGRFQTVRHRLAQCRIAARGIYFLALKAAWSGSPADADNAACHAQAHVQKLVFDLHQFNGAMGVTTDHTLHFWTYRLRALQAEAGGTYAAAESIAARRWGEAG